jgi:putative transposase
MALKKGCPEVHPSDRGVQYTSRAYVEQLLGLGVRLSYAGTGRPWENGHAERLIRTVKEEWVDLREYRTLEEARASVEAFVFEVYNRKRPHSALGYLTPEAFVDSLLKGGGSPD